MNLKELTKQYGNIELENDIQENFINTVIDTVQAELQLDDNAGNLAESLIKYGAQSHKNDSKEYKDLNIISNLNDWVDGFEPSDYYWANSKLGGFDREAIVNDRAMLFDIAGDCDEAIMDALRNEGDPDWQLAYEAMSRIALIIEDIDFNIEELGLDEYNKKKFVNKQK